MEYWSKGDVEKNDTYMQNFTQHSNTPVRQPSWNQDDMSVVFVARAEKSA
jgi:hypothetical protein